MHSFMFIITLVFSVVVAVFALQNSDPIAVGFLFWHFKSVPLVIIMLGSALFGAFVTFVFSLRKSVSNKLKMHDLNKKLDAAQKQVSETSVKLEAAAQKTEKENQLVKTAEENKEGGSDK